MSNYLADNFCIIQTAVGVLSIGAILANSINEARRSEAIAKKARAAVEESRRRRQERQHPAELAKEIQRLLSGPKYKG